MKKILYFAIAMFAVISFSACSDEDDNGHTSNNPILVRQCIYTNGDDNPTIYTFEYDNQNRIVRVTNNYNHSETQFSYSGNTVTETLIYTNGGFDTRICQLNADGYIESITDYQYPEDLQLYSEQLVSDEVLPIGINAAKEDTDLLLQCLMLELPIWCSEKTKATQHS